jgi:hypothetical protein
MVDHDTPRCRADRAALPRASSALRRQTLDLTDPANREINYAAAALLDAISRSLATRPQSLPTTVHDTAVRFADLIDRAARADNSITDRQPDANSLLELRHADARDIADADRMQLPR